MATRTWTGDIDGDWADAGNWLEAAVPVNADDVYIPQGTPDIDEGLGQSAVTLTSLTIEAGSGKIGTAAAYLEISATTVNVNRRLDTTSVTPAGRIKLKGVYTTVNVHDGATSPADTGFQSVMLASGGTIGTVNVQGGKVGIATATATETTTVTTLNVTKGQNITVDPAVTIGQGATVTNLNTFTGVTVANNSNNTVAAAKVNGGDYTVNGNGAHTALTVFGGTCKYNGTGTIAALGVYEAIMDFRGDQRAKTVTACDTFKGAKLYADTGVLGSITFTNGIDLNGVDLSDVTLKIGNGRRLTLGTAA
jgi:hypothetical protein